MDIIIVLAVVAAIWFVASGNYKTKVQDPQTLRPHEIENSIIELKNKILVTSAYEKEYEYRRLYERLTLLMEQVLTRHQHFVLNVEVSGLVPIGFFSLNRQPEFSGGQNPTYSLKHDFDPSGYSPELLIYACFFLWHGGRAKGFGVIDANPKIMVKILDHLIDEMQYGPALFMKGMVRKYGLRIYSECFPEEARKFLEQAKDAGVGSAAIELEYLTKYSHLAGVKSVQLGEN